MQIDEEFQHSLLGEIEIYDFGESLSSFLEIQIVSPQKDEHRFNIAAIHNDKYLTYKTLNSRANFMARNILKTLRSSKHELGAEICIGLLLDEGFDRLIAILSCIKLGVSVMPLNAEKSMKQFQEIIKKTNIDLIIYDKNNEINFDNFDFKPYIIFVNFLLSDSDQKERNNLLESEILISYNAENNVIILCTSGSSGSSKVIGLTHKQIYNRIFWQWKHLPYRKEEKVCHRTGFMFVDNIIEYFSCLLSGITMVIVSPIEACNFVNLSKLIYKYKITWLLSIPSLLQRWLNEVDNNPQISDSLKTLRTVVCSGEMMLPNLAIRFMGTFQQNKCCLINLYGSTEVTGDITCQVFRNTADIIKYTYNGFLSVGLPLTNNTILLKPCTEDNLEIIVIGNNVSPCCGKVFHSGDNGFIYKKRLYVSGRIDDMVKINGKKLFTKEIDDVIMLHNLVIQSYTVHVTFLNRQFLTSFITLKDIEIDKVKLKFDLTNIIKQGISKFINPRLEVLSHIPLLRNSMKPDKVALKSLAKTLLQEENIVSIPFGEKFIDLSNKDLNKDSDPYKFIHNVFAKHLSIDPKLLLDTMNFFDIGGDSLTAITCVADLINEGFICSTNVFLNDINSPDDASIKTIIYKVLHGTFYSNPENLIQRITEEFNVEEVKYEHKSEILNFLVANFLPKEILGIYLKVSESFFLKLCTEMFNEAISEKCSFIIRDNNTDKLIAVQLSGSFENKFYSLRKTLEFEITFENALLHFLDYCKCNVEKDRVRRSLNVNILAISLHLTKSKILQLLHFIEYHSISLAQLHGFESIETVNTSEVTRTICKELGYKIIKTSSLLEFLQRFLPNFPLDPNFTELMGYYMAKDI